MKLYMFRTVPLAINGICHTGLLTTCEQVQDVLKLLASCQQNCMTYHCCGYSEKLLMMARGTVRNMKIFVPKINLRN